MSFSITIDQLITVLDAAAVNVPENIRLLTATGICTDTRILQPGEVFLALRGTQFDGHQFVPTAWRQGAIAAIVERGYDRTDTTMPLLLVRDTLKAYQAIAHWWRQQFNIPVIGVTGSVGKTTTKELMAAVLGTQGQVLKTEQNYNNEIGVPKTLLGLTSEHKYAVIEMAMRGAGQIAELTEIARPTIGVITNVGTAHIELLGSEAAIAAAKCELLEKMNPDGWAILNHDNARLIKTAATVWQGKTLTYGLESGELRGKLINSEILQVEGFELPLPLVGRHNALNYLAALAVARVLGVSWQPLTEGLAVNLPEGRSKRYHLPNDIVVLDETYNAGLESMTAALHLLMETPGKRHIAVLGTMKELGDRSLEFHQQVGAIAHDLGVDALFIFADLAEAEAMAVGAGDLPFLEILDTSQPKALDFLAQRLKEFALPGDRILFKASHSVQLNQVVQKFMIN